MLVDWDVCLLCDWICVGSCFLLIRFGLNLLVGCLLTWYVALFVIFMGLFVLHVLVML